MEYFEPIIKLTIMGLIPVVLSVVLFLLIKKTKLGKANYWVTQVLVGILFGGFAILSTECGIPMSGAMINVRDAAPLCAGLIFGPTAGLVSGIIGAVERYFAAFWGVGVYTQWACVLGTLAAGLVGALIKRFVFGKRAVKWYYGLAVGASVETFHMFMVYLTHLDDVENAYSIVAKCYVPMVVACSVSVALATFITYLLDKRLFRPASIYKDRKKPTISSVFQIGLLFLVLIGFALSIAFMTVVQTNLSNSSALKVMNLNAQDVIAEIEQASNKNLLSITETITKSVEEYLDLKESGKTEMTVGEMLKLAKETNDVSEVSIIDKNGIITYSSKPEYVGFDMASGAQAAEFLCLLDDTNNYVQSYQAITYNENESCKYAGVQLEDGGFVQVGYDAERFQKDIDDKIRGISENRRIGENGFIIVANKDWELVSDPLGYTGQNLNVYGIWIDTNTMPEGTNFAETVNDVPCLWNYHTIEGYYIVSVYPEAEAFLYRNIGVYETIQMEIVVFFCMFILIFLLIKRIVVDNFRKVNIGLNSITDGNLDVKIDVTDNREFEALSDGINTTVDKLKEYIAEAEQRIDAELKYAKEIQHSVLPNIFPPFPDNKEIDIFATMETAKQVGGDFYDFYMLPDNRLAFLMADVSGKGIPAAMFMMRSRTLIKSLAEMGLSVEQILYKANDKLCKNNDSNMFVTAWMGILDLNTGHVDFVNAGHNFPLVKLGKNFEYLETTPDFILAGWDGFKYKKYSLNLKKGDMLFLYTDGVTEAQDVNGQLYGESRLHKYINSLEHFDVTDICNKIMADVHAYAGKAEQSDDITMLCLRYNGIDYLDEDNEITVPAEITSIEKVTEFVNQKLKVCNVDESVIRDVAVINDEIVSNIANYAYEDSTGQTVTVRIDELSDTLKMTYIDSGYPYNPLEKQDPDITLAASERAIGGLGIFLVKKMTDNMTYYYEDGKNHLQIEKSIR